MYIKTLLPIITTLVNKSITESYVPATFRKAVVRPLLKKPGLDQNVLKKTSDQLQTCRSYLRYLKKQWQIVLMNTQNQTHYTMIFNLLTVLAILLRTALLRVRHGITLALDNNSCAVLVMLDLSATSILQTTLF